MMNVTHTNSTVNLEEQRYLAVMPFVVILIHVVNYLLGLPLNGYIMVLLLGRRRGLDPCDVFTLNQAAVEIFFMLLAPFHSMCSVKSELCFYQPLGFFLGSGMWACSFFQCWVCLEHYMAVIHPVIFLRFKPLRYRVAFAIVAWTSGLACGVICLFTFPNLPYTAFGFVYFIILTVNVFSCMSILKKLRHPGPGDRNREREDRAKKRAFQVVTINLLTFLIQNIPIAVVFGILNMLSIMVFRMSAVISMTINIAMGFVQPVFVLHKAGKLLFIKSVCFSR